MFIYQSIYLSIYISIYSSISISISRSMYMLAFCSFETLVRSEYISCVLKCAEIRIMKWPLKNFLMETFLTCIKKINDVFSNEASSMPPKIAGREFHRHDLLPISDFPELAISFWIDFFLPIFFSLKWLFYFLISLSFDFPFPYPFPFPVPWLNTNSLASQVA